MTSRCGSLCIASRSGVGHLILDSFDELERCERLLDLPQDVLIRVTPGIKPSTHDYVQTGQLDSKFGFGLEDGLAMQAIERTLESEKLNLVGLHAHIGSQIFEQITELPEYYLTRTERSILERYAVDILQQAGSSLTLVELGAGTASVLSAGLA